MNDAMTAAAETKQEQSKDAHDFVEMGKVSEQTKGGLSGDWFDGGLGRYYG